MSGRPFEGAHELSEEDQRLWCSFVELSGNIQTAIHRQLARDGGLSRAEYDVLTLLSHSHAGTARQRDLVHRLGWQRSRISHLLSRMISRGLLERLAHEAGTPGADARRMEVRITPAGCHALARVVPGHIETVRSVLLDLISPQERDAVLSISGKVAPQVRQLGLD